jgi:cell division transport system ATP-binding protein
MIYFDSVTKIYSDNTKALENISIKIAPHEFVSIVGHSGAGKTSLIKLLLAEEKPSSGSVYFESADVHKMRKRDMKKLRRRIGTIFQDFRLLPNKNVYENIAFAMEVAGKTDDEIASDVPHVLQLVGLDNKFLNFPHELSGGEQQRVAIARAIVNQPDVIIADEPTGNLDPVNTYEIVQILKKINDLGTTVILTTHNKGVIDELGRRVIVMDNGRIVNDDASGKYTI